MWYVSWRGSKPSDFFSEAVKSQYDMELPMEEIDAYYDLKDKMVEGAESRPQIKAVGEDGRLPPAYTFLLTEELVELKKALMKRLLASIELLDQVQRDKPGNWKLWREKLISEHFWATLCEAEKVVGEEIDACVAEAEDLEPGWKQFIFRQAVQMWRVSKQREVEKKEEKKMKVKEKKGRLQAEKAKTNEVKQSMEDQKKQEREAERMMAKLIAEEERKEKKKPGGAKAKAKAPSSATKKK